MQGLIAKLRKLEWQAARFLVRRWVRLALTRPDWEAYDARWTAVLACDNDADALRRLDRLHWPPDLISDAIGTQINGGERDGDKEYRNCSGSGGGESVEAGVRSKWSVTARMNIRACWSWWRRQSGGEAEAEGANAIDAGVDGKCDGETGVGVFQTAGERRVADLDHLYEQVRLPTRSLYKTITDG